MCDVNGDHREIRVIRAQLIAKGTFDGLINLELDHAIDTLESERPSVLQRRLAIKIVVGINDLKIASSCHLLDVLPNLSHKRNTRRQVTIGNLQTRTILTLTDVINYRSNRSSCRRSWSSCRRSWSSCRRSRGCYLLVTATCGDR